MKKNVMSIFKPLRAVFKGAELPGHGEDTGLDLGGESLDASLSSVDANDEKQQYQRLEENFASQLSKANPNIAAKYQARLSLLKDSLTSGNNSYGLALDNLTGAIDAFHKEMPEQETTVAKKPKRKKAPSRQDDTIKMPTLTMHLDPESNQVVETEFNGERTMDFTEQEIQSTVKDSEVFKAMTADAKEYQDNPEMEELRRSIAETMAQGMDAVRDPDNPDFDLFSLANTMDELLDDYNQRKADILVSRDTYVTRADEQGRPISAASDGLSKETFFEDEGDEITGDPSSNEELASFDDDLDNNQSIN